MNFDRKVEMVSFELGEELRKMFFRLVTSVGQRKILSPHEESNLRPLRSDALPLSHKDSSVSRIYYEVLMTLLTEESLWLSSRTSERKSKGLRFDSSWGLRIFQTYFPR